MPRLEGEIKASAGGSRIAQEAIGSILRVPWARKPSAGAPPPSGTKTANLARIR
jgi:hypothetical protein